MQSTGQPISVVVLTHNRVRDLLRTVGRMVALPEQPPIVVVDNASGDGTAIAVKQAFPQVKVIPLANNLGAAARNLGVRNVATPYVAFCDDDTYWAAGSISRAAELLDTYPEIAAVTARVLVGEEQREDPACAEMAASLLPSDGLPGRSVLGFLAGAAAFRRAAFLDVGGFEPKFFLGGEEQLLAFDLVTSGWKVVYTDQVTVHHHPSANRDGILRRRLLTRNAIWVTWLRRSPLRALRCTLQISRRAFGDPVRMAGVVDALRELPWALRNRRRLPPHIDEWRDLLDRGRNDSDGIPGILQESRD